jgi:hypothetical protein
MFILCLLLLVVIANVKASIETLESEVKGIQQAMKNDTSVSTLDSIKRHNKDSQNSGVLGRMAKYVSYKWLLSLLLCRQLKISPA